MKILITGATGFIGGHLVEALLKERHEVKALVRQKSDASQLEARGVVVAIGDITDATSVKNAVQGCDRVYHLAGKTTKDRLTKELYRTHNIEGTTNVAEAALHTGVQRMVYSSSVGVYGTARPHPIDEETEPRPDSYYRESKLGGEKAALRLYRERGLPIVIARVGSVYGPGSCNWLDLARKILEGSFRIIGSGENYDHFAYVDDIVHGLQQCAETSGVEGRTYILSGPEPLKLRQLLQIMAEELGVDPVLGRLPSAPFRFYHRLGGVVYQSLGIQVPRAHYYDLFYESAFCHDQGARRIRLRSANVPARWASQTFRLVSGQGVFASGRRKDRVYRGACNAAFLLLYIECYRVRAR